MNVTTRNDPPRLCLRRESLLLTDLSGLRVEVLPSPASKGPIHTRSGSYFVKFSLRVVSILGPRYYVRGEPEGRGHVLVFGLVLFYSPSSRRVCVPPDYRRPHRRAPSLRHQTSSTRVGGVLTRHTLR